MLSRNKAVCVASPSYMGGGGAAPSSKVVPWRWSARSFKVSNAKWQPRLPFEIFPDILKSVKSRKSKGLWRQKPAWRRYDDGMPRSKYCDIPERSSFQALTRHYGNRPALTAST